MTPLDTASRGWRKSSYSSPNADNCLEVQDGHPAGVPVRDSKRPEGPALRFSAAAWGAFLDDLERPAPPRGR
ncbi:DUF397 domain-containing protein [Streptomyces triticirhizae]|uniref:DUF397 domain-containing protein n=1 Tax=Streptomyces triticirhizae TaxID=2483353 RepID=A0A3M2LSH7_9ACTN|nr:DUF397 domain-containing protein [Streptomyces triticirhizae]RMI39533.1 DUF397 domain-containing protein [Streptomyces triticirhizae]